jgi:hypothetical protein
VSHTPHHPDRHHRPPARPRRRYRARSRSTRRRPPPHSIHHQPPPHHCPPGAPTAPPQHRVGGAGRHARGPALAHWVHQTLHALLALQSWTPRLRRGLGAEAGVQRPAQGQGWGQRLAPPVSHLDRSPAARAGHHCRVQTLPPKHRRPARAHVQCWGLRILWGGRGQRATAAAVTGEPPPRRVAPLAAAPLGRSSPGEQGGCRAVARKEDSP